MILVLCNMDQGDRKAKIKTVIVLSLLTEKKKQLVTELYEF